MKPLNSLVVKRAFGIRGDFPEGSGYKDGSAFDTLRIKTKGEEYTVLTASNFAPQQPVAIELPVALYALGASHAAICSDEILVYVPVPYKKIKKESLQFKGYII